MRRFRLLALLSLSTLLVALVGTRTLPYRTSSQEHPSRSDVAGGETTFPLKFATWLTPTRDFDPIQPTPTPAVAVQAAITATPAPIVADGSSRDEDQIVSSHAARANQHTTPAVSATDVLSTTALTSTDLLTAASISTTDLLTSTVPLTATDEVPPMTPEEIAAAEAAMRDGQARMGRARTEFRLATIAAAEQEVRDAEKALEKVRAENVKPEDIAASEEELQTAEADLERIRQENLKLEEVSRAEADVLAAEERLRIAQNGPDPAMLAAAQEKLTAAQQNFDTVAANMSAAKTAAEQARNGAADALRIAQETFSTSYWQNEQAKGGIDPVSGRTFDDADLDEDSQKQQYADALVAAQAQVNTAQTTLDQAAAAYEQAKQQEIDAINAAQIQLDQARTELEQMPQVSDPANVAAAQQQLDQARAHLAQLQQTVPALTDAQKRVDETRAKLDKQRADFPAAEKLIAEAQKRVEDAKVQLDQKRRSAVGKGGWTWPTYGILTSGFGKRNLQVNANHNGLDIANNKATPIGAARDGTVIEAGWCKGYGFCVKIDHGSGFTTEYGHMASMPPVKAGDVVKAGTMIGLMGTSYDAEHGGYSTGVHLHFTIRRYGIAVDPLLYLP